MGTVSRKLCYGEKELLWYCETGYLKKVTPSPLTLVTTSLTTGSLGGGAPGAIFHQRDYVPPEGTTRLIQWMYILSDVTARTLTVNNDRLNAVTGIINELKPLWRDECSYGLWQESFLKQLSWYHYLNNCKSNHSNRLEIAPSWSWASRTCAILHDDVEPFNLSWRLNGAKLILEAKVLKYVDRLVTEFAQGWAFFWDDPVRGHVQTPNTKGLEIHYLLLGSRRPHFIKGVEGCRVSGLILSLQSDGTFERVGVFLSHFFTRIFDSVQTQEVRIV